MVVTSCVRDFDVHQVWDRMPSQQQVQDWLPPEKQVQLHLKTAWDRLCVTVDALADFLVQMHEESRKLQAEGWSEYSVDAKDRLSEWWLSKAEVTRAVSEPSDDEGAATAEMKRKRAANIASKIKGHLADRNGAGGSSAAKPAATDAPRIARGRRRRPGK
ncbi:unnamed protein product [Polarella glacialis]|uniref:Uncharacterized protein n=1 Tax=Polarella glacialis TaxID=89957 RepID=A0A813JHQ9_POLGL|nr:unnamed protein product [Polarella glacialis]CAE8677308.1 unnamed protein product [Polarella glacialis]